MRNLRLLVASVLVPLIVTGCAQLGIESKDDRFSWCIVGGAVAGAAAGVATDGEVGGALIGLASGAVLGQLLCQGDDEMMVADTDGDGVNDDMDKCPGTPKIAHGYVGADGCPTNSDGDKVPDYLDRCPGTPAGVDTDQWGCPPDTDGDGVFDYLDKCPGTPRGTYVDADGCPEAGETIAIITNVNFDFDSARLRADARQKLGEVIGILRDNPEVDVRVIGHTDSVGTPAYNQGLSERRAASVRKFLVDNGVRAGRLTTAGRGESEPLVSNANRAGRAVNRRVEFEVVE